MNIKELQLENYRCFEKLDMKLDERLTVIIGDNGAGKTSVLEALSVALGSLFLRMNDIPTKSMKSSDAHASEFRSDDPFDEVESRYPVKVECSGVIDGKNIRWMRELTGPNGNTGYKDAGEMAEVSYDFQTRVMKGDTGLILPLVAYYGSGRLSDTCREKPVKGTLMSRMRGYDTALDGTVNLKLMNKWFLTSTVDKYQRLETNYAQVPYLDTVLEAMAQCLEGISGYHDVCVIYELERKSLSVIYTDTEEKRNKTSIESMSLGYRNIMYLIADMAYRMALLNPQSGSGILSSPGVILIDEVDLHLHPQWQGRILEILLRIFPRVQFIVTTDSPLIINSVRKENLIILSDEHEVKEAPCEVYGMEAGSVLRDIMDSGSRPAGITGLFSAFYKAMALDEEEEAERILFRLGDLIGKDDPEYREAETFLFLERK